MNVRAFGWGLATLGLLVACTPGATPEPPTRVTVFAAASLTGAFTDLGERFEAAHPGVEVVFSFGASSTLARQLTEGAPADVFAAASPVNLATVADAGLTGPTSVFASNQLILAVPADNPARLSGLDDLARPGVTVAVCQPEVPCGALTGTVLANAGVAVAPSTLEADVRAVLTKVRLGEVDAGLVYVTDARAAGDDVLGIPIPDDVNAATAYLIAWLRAAPSGPLAREFVDLVLSEEGSFVLAEAGFAPPAGRP